MRIQCYVCLRNATHEYEGHDYCDNCEPYEPWEEEGESDTPFQDAIDLLNTHDGMRFEGVRGLISKMRQGDVQLITDFCIKRERQLTYDKSQLEEEL